MKTEDLIRVLVLDSLIFRKRGASIERTTTLSAIVAGLDLVDLESRRARSDLPSTVRHPNCSCAPE